MAMTIDRILAFGLLLVIKALPIVIFTIEKKSVTKHTEHANQLCVR